MFKDVILPIIIAVIYLCFALIFDKLKKNSRNEREMKLSRKRFFRIVGIAVCYLGTAPTLIYGIFSLANGTLLFVGLYLFFVPELKLLAYRIFPNAAKPIMKVVWGIFFFGLTVSLSMFVFLITAQFNTPKETEGTVVVLGSQVKGDYPTRSLATRIDAAFEYLSVHPQTVCIATGGQGEGENMTEAECIKNYLVKRGIDESRIICENEAINTDTNIKYTARIIEEKGLDKNIVIVTESYHQRRGCLYAEKYGLSAASYSSHSPFALQCSAWVREMFGLVKFAMGE